MIAGPSAASTAGHPLRSLGLWARPRASATIDEDALYKAASVARPELVKNLLEVSLNGDFIKARDALDGLLIEYGLSGEDVEALIAHFVLAGQDLKKK